MGPFLHLLRTRDVPKTFKDMTIENTCIIEIPFAVKLFELA